MLIIIGVMNEPLLVAEAPSTPWKKSGMKMIDPNIANPVMNTATSEMLTTRFA